jgi:hypothetical protein
MYICRYILHYNGTYFFNLSILTQALNLTLQTRESRGQFFKAKSAFSSVGAYQKVGAHGKVGALQLPRRELTPTQVLKNCPLLFHDNILGA